MKKIIALLLVLLMAFSLSACADNSMGDDDVTGVESKGESVVLENAKKGEITGCQYKIGDSIDTIYADYSLDADGNLIESDDIDLDNQAHVSGDETVRVDTGKARYYFHNAKRADGVAYIADFNDAYAFHVGFSQAVDVKNEIAITPTEEKIVYDVETKEGEIPMFYKGVPYKNLTLVNYDLGEYDLTFYFEDDVLTATVLYSKALWE